MQLLNRNPVHYAQVILWIICSSMMAVSAWAEPQQAVQVVVDHADSVAGLRELAQKGDADAQNKLGKYFLQQGDDYAQARLWFQRSADQHFAEAQNNMGVLYQHGLGVEQDVVKAMHWYQQAAAQGLPVAQSNIGFLYDEGLGVPQSNEQAMHRYLTAIKQHDAQAFNNLGVMFARGSGVPRNVPMAYALYTLATRHDPEYTLYSDNRNTLQIVLDTAELKLGQQYITEMDALNDLIPYLTHKAQYATLP